jgi:steroid delta-isomerase-like uncharacterized protein
MMTALRFDRRTLVAGTAALALSVCLFSAAHAQDDALKVVEDYLAAWNAHDSAAAAALLAEDVTYYDAAYGSPIMGRDTAKTAVIDNFMGAVPDANWMIKGEPVVAGDQVAFEWEFTGTNTGTWADGTVGTGAAFTLAGLSIFRVEGGLIAYEGDYYDALGLFTQLGLIE